MCILQALYCDKGVTLLGAHEYAYKCPDLYLQSPNEVSIGPM